MNSVAARIEFLMSIMYERDDEGRIIGETGLLTEEEARKLLDFPPKAAFRNPVEDSDAPIPKA